LKLFKILKQIYIGLKYLLSEAEAGLDKLNREISDYNQKQALLKPLNDIKYIADMYLIDCRALQSIVPENLKNMHVLLKQSEELSSTLNNLAQVALEDKNGSQNEIIIFTNHILKSGFEYESMFDSLLLEYPMDKLKIIGYQSDNILTEVKQFEDYKKVAYVCNHDSINIEKRAMLLNIEYHSNVIKINNCIKQLNDKFKLYLQPIQPKNALLVNI